MSATLPDPFVLEPRTRMPKLVRWMALSLALHAVLLAWSPRLRMKFDEPPVPPPMTVSLRTLPAPAEPQAAPPPMPEVVQPPPPAKAARERKAREAPPKEPVVALVKPAPAAPVAPVIPPAPQAVEPPAPVTPQVTAPLPAETDLAAYVEARRRAREGVDPGASEADRANRGALASAALKPSAPLNFEKKKPTANSGWFRIDRRGADYAQFTFFGWNENFGRNWLQQFDVSKGNHSSIDIAVIRSIIEIIRRYETGDFQWHSKRLGKTLVLSARARDNAGLEEFMLQEFYEDLHRYR